MFGLALIAMSFAFMGGAVIVAVPVVIVLVLTLGLVDFNRRRKQARSMSAFRDDAKGEKVDFTERDQETLVSE